MAAKESTLTRSINLELHKKLQNRDYRRAFFKLRTQDDVAEAIRAMRDRRKMTQKELAALCAMKQSAISRIEQSGYNAWTLNTLLRVADALDACIRVEIDASEDVVAHIEQLETGHYIGPRGTNIEAAAGQSTPFRQTIAKPSEASGIVFAPDSPFLGMQEHDYSPSTDIVLRTANG